MCIRDSASTEPSGWEWSRGVRAEPDDHRCSYEQRRARVESMVVRVLVGRDKLFQTRAVIGWEDGEEDGRPGRLSPTLSSHHDACDGGADQLR